MWINSYSSFHNSRLSRNHPCHLCTQPTVVNPFKCSSILYLYLFVSISFLFPLYPTNIFRTFRVDFCFLFSFFLVFSLWWLLGSMMMGMLEDFLCKWSLVTSTHWCFSKMLKRKFLRYWAFALFRQKSFIFIASLWWLVGWWIWPKLQRSQVSFLLVYLITKHCLETTLLVFCEGGTIIHISQEDWKRETNTSYQQVNKRSENRAQVS